MADVCALSPHGGAPALVARSALGLFHTPNAHLGIALSLLFAARVLYWLGEIFVLSTAASGGWSGFARSPLTLAVFGLLAGYYIGYAIGLLRWRARVMRIKRALTAPPALDAR